MLKKKKKKRRGSRFRCMRFLCSVFSKCESRGLPTTTNPSTGTPERICARRERERVSILFRFLLISLLYRLICQMGFPKTKMMMTREERTDKRTHDLENRKKKKLPRRTPPFSFLFLFLIPQSITILNPRLVPIISYFSPTESEVEAEGDKSNLGQKKTFPPVYS